MTARLDRHPLAVRDSYPASADVADVVAQGVRAGFGVLSLALGIALRTLGEATAAEGRGTDPRMSASEVADLLVGSAWGAARLSGRLAATGARIAAPVLGLTLRPPLVPQRLQPDYAVQRVIDRWQRDRPDTVRALGRWSAAAVPGAVDAALAQVDLQRVVAVALNHANLDALITDIVRRLDLESIAVEVLERVDLARILSVALDRIDLTQLVLDRVDLERVASSLLRRLDLTTVVIDQVDLGRVVGAALERIDLTEIVLHQVDLGSVVDAALERVDLTEIVLHQVDLIGVAEYVVDGIDLPEIIRDSTGSVASDAVRGLRIQGADADLALGRAVDRILHRRRQRRTEYTPEDLTLPDQRTDAQRGQQE